MLSNEKEAAESGSSSQQRDLSMLEEIADILEDYTIPASELSSHPESHQVVTSATSAKSRDDLPSPSPRKASSGSGSASTRQKARLAPADGLSEEQLALLMDKLCHNENGFDLISERIKISMNNTKEAALFLKKRALIEEEYAGKILKLVAGSSRMDQEKGSLSDGYRKFLQIHTQIAESRQSSANAFMVLSEDLNTLQKNTEKSRRQLKDAASKHWKYVGEVESQLDKARSKYETCSEEWEKAVRAKSEFAEGRSTGPSLPANPTPSDVKALAMNIFSGGKNATNPQRLQRAEEDFRLKTFSSNEAYKQQLARTNAVRREFFNRHLPQFIKSFKDTNDECELGLKLHLVRYAQEIENAIMKEATTVSPLEQQDSKDGKIQGLVKSLDAISPASDFVAYVDRFIKSDARSKPYDKNDIEYREFSSSLPPTPTAQRSDSKDATSGKVARTPTTMSQSPSADPRLISNSDPSPYFGVDLARQLDRDDREVPLVVEKCVEFLENGSDALTTAGIYRVPGSTAIVTQLRREFVCGEQTDLSTVTNDPHDVTSLLKLFFRQLPEPVFTHELYPRFLAAAKRGEDDPSAADDRVRVIAIHELVNLLPDANYATLRAIMRHLYNVSRREEDTLMNAVNLGIVWGPTLMVGAGTKPGSQDVTGGAMEFKHQAKVVETVLANFEGIFEM